MDIKHLFRHWTYQVFAPGALLREKYNAFKKLLRYDNLSLELIADLEDIYYGHDQAEWTRIVWLYNRLAAAVRSMVEQLKIMTPSRYLDLGDYFRKLDFYVRLGLDLPAPDPSPPYILPLHEAHAHKNLTGGKAANLASVALMPQCNVPPGFVITVNAFHYFIESNELRPKLDNKLRQLQLSAPERISELAVELQQLILDAEIPATLAQAIEEAVGSLIGVQGNDVPRLAMRSSAVAEDSDVSFAGQYTSELFVPPYVALDAYKKVLAGKYGARALTYRIRNGLADQETPMAVLVMPMVRAKAAGVVYTMDEEVKGSNTGAIYAVPGQGALLVDGSLRPEVIRFSREKIPQLVPQAAAEDPILPKNKAKELANLCLTLEKHSASPLDIEWALDHRGTLFFLQSRPLQAVWDEDKAPEFANITPEHPPLCAGGECASAGTAAGVVHHVRSVIDVGAVPRGSVLVVQTLTPALARLADDISAVVARGGSRASHFASVAREQGLPVLVGIDDPFNSLRQGQLVTVHADDGTVYAGALNELLARYAGKTMRRRGPVSQRLQKVIPIITRLTLTNAEDEAFLPEHCRSLHDIIRFSHEKSVQEMFSLVGKGGRGLSQAKKLESHLPLVLYVLDLGGGLFQSADNKNAITPDDIQSLPMWALWFGLSSKDVLWNERLLHVDWEEMDRIAAGIFRHDAKRLASYAVLSKDYLHMMIRFGYHFSVLDTVCGAEENSNYINFRFKGGGGDFDQRLLRLELIKRVLEHFGFSTEIRGDMLTAMLSRQNENVVQKRLASLGYLLARTRLMDMGLHDETQVRDLVREFIQPREPDL